MRLSDSGSSSSDICVDPVTSEKRTVTTLRISSLGGSSASGAPQALQKRAPGAPSVPHAAQMTGAVIAVPGAYRRRAHCSCGEVSQSARALFNGADPQSTSGAVVMVGGALTRAAQEDRKERSPTKRGPSELSREP